jgi:membrane fusion protein (multidrug efflux system)
LIEAENISLNQLKSTEILYQKNAASKKDLEEKKRIFLNAKKESQRASFRAPIAGVVGIFKNHIGDNIKSGNELVDIYTRGALYIDFSIPENILPYIKKGQDVYIKSQKNTLSDVQYVLDVETYMAPARVDFSCEDCIIGSYIDLDLVVQTHPKTIIIPFEAVFIKDTKNYVYIVKENKIKETSVTLGLREKEKIEILEGIKENDQIIVRGQSRLSDGQEVKIHNSEVK